MVSEILKLCMNKGFLLDKEMLEVFSNLSDEKSNEVIEILAELKTKERVITRDLVVKHLGELGCLESFLSRDESGFEKKEIEQNLDKAKERDLLKDSTAGVLKLLATPAFTQKKIAVTDFVKHFRMRYVSLKAILEEQGFENLSSIRKIELNRGNYTIIVAVLSKRVTKNKNLIVEVEDMTGASVVLVNQNKKELFEKCKELMVDDIVAFDVSGTKEMLFANEVIYPESRLEEKRYSEFDEYVAFISDFHAGSCNFLKKNLLKFVKWLNSKEGEPEQRALAKKVKYLIINGDNIDGVNHHPGQESFLKVKTSEGQYRVVEDILKLVRKDIIIVMSPGQHDTVWVGEPQPIIGEKYATGLHKIKNLHMVPNPSLIEINGGFKILMYHGASINRFIDEIPRIRTKHGHMSPSLSVKEMLKRRHLAPMHGMVDYIPCDGEDPLVIKTVPDIITTGDQHRAEVATHNNVLIVTSSCWQSITPFEDKVGNVPDPCKVPLFNLKTREMKILDFSDGEGAEKDKGSLEKISGEDCLEYGEVEVGGG
jgi:DNA polymerase II small subunit